MQTREWKTIDKADWPRGSWDDEPDKAQWTDASTGLPCLLHRSSAELGHLCGYVGVSADHPLHGLDYDDERLGDVEVHGGLTFAGACSPGATEASGICHAPDPGEPDDVWWFGFDCAHFRDLSPGTRRYADAVPGARYRDRAYVEAECVSLARQLAAA